MKLVFIAGPFRGKTPWEVEQNTRRAEAWGLSVAKCGAVPVIPHSMYRYFDRSLPDEFWLQATSALLERCEAIVAIPGWQRSAGATQELKLVSDRNMPACIFEETKNLYPSSDLTRTVVLPFVESLK